MQQNMSDEVALQRAMEESAREWYARNSDEPTTGFTRTSVATSSMVKSAGRDLAMDATVLRLGVEVGLMRNPDADTLVLIGEPPKMSYQTPSSYQRIISHYAQHHYVNSERLLSIGSSKFQQMLSIDKQTRLQRMYKKILPMGKPQGIKYVLDLRPPSEDEEAILLLTELSCPRNILNWSKAAAFLKVSPLMVDGQDDFDFIPDLAEKKSQFSISSTPLKTPDDKATKILKSSQRRAAKGTTQNDKEQKPPRRKLNLKGIMPRPPDPESELESESESEPEMQSSSNTAAKEPSHEAKSSTSYINDNRSSVHPDALLEYSPLRHRAAIERVMSAIELLDPHLDSAPKVWNFFGIAKHLECATHERINGWITKWVYAWPNSHFIQCNPEICYRIGLGIKSYDLTRASFSMLVGEEALSRVHNRGRPSGSLTIHGRLREHLDDDEQNRISHAAEHFVTTIYRTFQKLISMEQSFFSDLGKFCLVEGFQPENSTEDECRAVLIEALRGYVRGKILHVLNRLSPRLWSKQLHPLESNSRLHRDIFEHISGCTDFRAVYYDLTPEERLFTRSFWFMLKNERFAEPDDGGYVESDWWEELSPLTDGLDVMPIDMVQTVLKIRVNRFNELLIRRQQSRGHIGADQYAVHSYHAQVARNAPAPEPAHTETEDDPLEAMEHLTVSSSKRSSASFEPDTSSAGLKRQKKTPIQSIESRSAESDAPMSNTISTALPIRQRTAVTRRTEHADTTAAEQRDPSTITGRLTVTNPDPIPNPSDDEASASSSGVAKNPEAGQGLSEAATSSSGLANEALKESESDDDWWNIPMGNNTAGWQEWKYNNALGDEKSANTTDQHDEASGPTTGLILDWTQHTNIDRNVRYDPFFDTRGETFDLNQFLQALSSKIAMICSPVVDPPHIWQNDDKLPTGLMDTLMCLDEGSWKYLPLWAGGNDDGTGGVFDETNVPALESGGFSAPGPSIHTGASIASSDTSSFSDVASDAQSTVGKASAKATEGSVSSGSVHSINTNSDEMDSFWEIVRDRATGGIAESTVEGNGDKDGDMYEEDADDDESTERGSIGDHDQFEDDDSDDDDDDNEGVDHDDDNEDDDDGFEAL